ncbi:MAG TPA: hypothetical protein VMH39_08085 [Gemmatimonadaceae bacterium]|nr:hypothetical protein [Gemmatimonadaceae bacterium]
MVLHQQPATAQPAQTLESLPSQIAAAQTALDAAVAHRNDILGQIDAAQGPGERVQLRNGPLTGASDQVDRLTVQLTDLQADLRLLQATAAHSTNAQSGPTPASLRAEIGATQVSLNEALARRAGILARIDAAQGPAERAQLRNSALTGVDEQVGRFQSQLASLQAQLQQLEAAPQTPVAPARPQPTPLPVQPVVPAPTPTPAAVTLVPPAAAPRPASSSDILWMGAALVVLAPIAIAIAWRIAHSGNRAGKTNERLASEERMQRVEEVVESIATDVERVSEGHRFLTKVLVEKPAPGKVEASEEAAALKPNPLGR